MKDLKLVSDEYLLNMINNFIFQVLNFIFTNLALSNCSGLM